MDNEGRKLVMHTGEYGADQFDTHLVIWRCEEYPKNTPFDDMSEEYRKCREKLFEAKRKYRKLRYNKIVRFLIKLKIIKQP